MPGQGSLTRSAFGGTFLRLLTFDMVSIEPFYMRFGLLKQQGQRPMLAMGNIRARYSFWDLQRFEERATAGKDSTTVVKSEKRKRILAKKLLMNRTRANGDASRSDNEGNHAMGDFKGTSRFPRTSILSEVLTTFSPSSSSTSSTCRTSGL